MKKKNKKINKILESMSNITNELDKEIDKLVDDVENIIKDNPVKKSDLCADWILKKIMNLSDEEIKDAKYPISYIDRSYSDKRKILRQFMMKSKDANTAVMTMIIKIKREFMDLCKSKGWYNLSSMYSDAIIVDSLFIDGYLAFEKIYKDDTIVELKPLDPISLVADSVHGWIQFTDNESHKRILSKNQVLYIIGNPTLGLTSLVEGIYLNILDMENIYVIDNVCKRISDNIINAIEGK